MKLVITGGHLTPALAFIDYVQLHHPEVKMVFLGRIFARKNSKQPAHEKREVEQRGIEFVPFDSGKLVASHQIIQTIQLFLLFLSVPHALWLLLKHKASVIVSFGGYLAVPVCVAGWLLRIPIVTHEQTRVFGTANRIIGFFAKKIALSHSESLSFAPKSKSVIVGNPLRNALIQPSQTAPDWTPQNITKPLLYITGGSQGSEIINCVVGGSLAELAKHWFVIHQCGVSSQTRNYKQELLNQRSKLPSSLQSRFVVREWISDLELSWVYSHAAAVVARSGANTIDELIWFGIPAILIPLPFSQQNEQHINAQAMEKLGGAVVIEQKDFGPQTLLDALEKVAKQQQTMRKALLAAKHPKHACKKLFGVVQDAYK